MKKVWVVKDGQGNIVSSIRLIEKAVVAYISYHTIEDRVYMMYVTEDRASQVLDQLNQAKALYGFNLEFHIEEAEYQELITQSLAFTGENMVLVEKRVELVCAS